MESYPSLNLLGVRVDAVDLEKTVSMLESWIERGEANYVCLTNVHGIMECQRDPELKRIYNSAGLSAPDGMPLVWLSRSHGFAKAGRVYGPDLLEKFGELSEVRGHRHFLYGGAEGVAGRLASKLRRRFPRIQIVGHRTPPFRELTAEEDEDLVRAIRDAGADIVWVGLGTGKQDRFMRDHVARLDAVLVGVGAAFDFLSETKRQAPRWMQRAGLEWLFRLATEPRRLWRRYLLGNPAFLGKYLLQALGIGRYSREGTIASSGDAEKSADPRGGRQG